MTCPNPNGSDCAGTAMENCIDCISFPDLFADANPLPRWVMSLFFGFARLLSKHWAVGETIGALVEKFGPEPCDHFAFHNDPLADDYDPSLGPIVYCYSVLIGNHTFRYDNGKLVSFQIQIDLPYYHVQEFTLSRDGGTISSYGYPVTK